MPLVQRRRPGPAVRSGLAALLVLTALTAASCTARPETGETPPVDSVAIADGELRGEVTNSAVRFRGIPFAGSTAGENRWAGPTDVEPWEGVRDATEAGPRCAQPITQPGTPTEVAASESEDCLVLDVTAPASALSGVTDLPVLVWVHGGGLRTGAGSDYDMRDFAVEQNVVVVTPNYRLGAFGFLDLPELEGGGQFGLLDQVAALDWVHRNISAFGGDAANVTLAGESGGADAVCALVGSPDTAGLFDRAIVQSGTCSDTNILEAVVPGAGPEFSTWKSDAVGQELGLGFAAAAGCVDPQTAVACLQELATADVLAAAAASGAYFSPSIGVGMLPRHPSEAITDPDRTTVPLLTGWTSHEGGSFLAGFAAQPLTEVTFAAVLAQAAGPRAAEAAAAYERRGDETFNRVWSDVVTDRGWVCPNLRFDTEAAALTDVFVYEFADSDAPNVLTVVAEDVDDGALHGTELAYLFRHDPGQPELSPAQERLAREMRDAWGSFIREGEPDGWSEYGTSGVVHRLAGGGMEMVSADDVVAERHCELWAAAE